MNNVLIIGATSAIAEATARRYAEGGHRLFLLARNRERLRTIADDLQVRGATSVDWGTFDVLDFERHHEVLQTAIASLGDIDIALVAHGTLPDQSSCERSADATLREFEVNATGTILLLTHLANYFEGRSSGVIAVISSVAGDRGRRSNYVYGAAKAAVSTFLQGVRARLHRSGVGVVTIKPGFVDTPMTRDFRKNRLWARPETIARAIERAIARNQAVCYTPRFWFAVMGVIKLLPETVMKRLPL